MIIHCVSIFPEIIFDALKHSIPGKAQERGILDIHFVQLRDFSLDKHHKTDDLPYGGGAGMVFTAEPAVRSLEHLRTPDCLVIHPSPAAPPFKQCHAVDLARQTHLIFLASRYEGLDQRVIDGWVDREYSLGDFVISGGELATAVMIDAVVRLLPGAVGNPESVEEDSFSHGLLDYPHYTRPADFHGRSVPEVLLGGHHEQIRRWRKRQSLERTLRIRPDLLKTACLDDEAKAMLNEINDTSQV